MRSDGTTSLRMNPAYADLRAQMAFSAALLGNLAIDAIPELGASGGNVLTYGETSVLFRLARNLAPITALIASGQAFRGPVGLIHRN